MGKENKEKRKSAVDEDDMNKEERWDELVGQVGPIAKPLASRKLTKKIFKVVKKGIIKASRVVSTVTVDYSVDCTTTTGSTPKLAFFS